MKYNNDDIYAQYAYRPRKAARSRRTDRGVVLLVVLFSLIGILAVVFVFSDALGIAWLNKDSIKVDFAAKNYYAVQLYSASTQSDANTKAATVIEDGGAGYVRLDNSYYVFAFVYPNQADAERVINGIDATKYDASLFMIQIAQKSISFLGTSAQSQRVAQCVEQILLTTDAMYDIILRLDKGQIDASSARNEMKVAYNILNSCRAEYEQLTAEQTLSQYAQIKSELIKALDLLDNLIKSTVAAKTFSSSAKYCVLQIIFGYYDLIFIL